MKDCKDCDKRHLGCHASCPDHAKRTAEREALRLAKERERIGTRSVGKDRSCTNHQKWINQTKYRKEYR